jgi:hypothetical protein
MPVSLRTRDRIGRIWVIVSHAIVALDLREFLPVDLSTLASQTTPHGRLAGSG